MLSAGPPEVIMYAWVKYWKVPIKPMITLKRMTGEIMGIVTWIIF